MSSNLKPYLSVSKPLIIPVTAGLGAPVPVQGKTSFPTIQL